MTTANSPHTFYSWNTKKTLHGFRATISKVTAHSELQANGRYSVTEIVKQSGVFSTRAKATRYAKKMKMYLTQKDQ
ncbi:MAG: hypothetical protein CMJ20_02455 [Phycisphaeraceae bacterium]|nr:hypothetical protein [Phycisphaeraceae bacterium]|tara:strand:- start:875 stop:1102 length:228 start_codon:yes stop_codon:yes gene_type:complete